MEYNFDEPIMRRGTHSIKYDLMGLEYNDPEIIGMRIADTDFAAPSNILEILKKRLDHRVLGYTMPYEKFYSSVSDFFVRHTGWSFDPSHIQFSPGIISIIGLSIMNHSEKGDQVAVFSPGYPPLFKVVTEGEREVLPIPLVYNAQDGTYSIDFDLFERSLTPKTKIFLFSNPYNPLGRVWTREELERIAQICLSRNIVIISDEINAFTNFAPFPYTPMASLSPEIANNTISCFSPGKLYDITGLIFSFSVMSNEAFRKKHEKAQYATGMAYSTRSVMGHSAISVCYDKQNDGWITQKMEYIQNNAQFVMEYCKDNLPEIIVTPSEATAVLWLNFRAFKLSDLELEKKLIQEAHVALVPGVDYGKEGKGFCRMNIGCTKLTLKTALTQIYRALKNY